MSNVEKFIENVVEYASRHVNSAGSIEVEARLRNIDRDKFKNLMEALDAGNYKRTEEMSINVISRQSNEHGQQIRRKIFKDDGAVDDTTYIKTNIIKESVTIVDSINYTLSAATETIIKNGEKSINPLLRIKMRYSYQYKNWRCDLTVVRQFNFNQSKDLKKDKDQTFEYRKRPTDIPDSMRPSFEIEMEYTGDVRKLTSDEFSDIKDIIILIDPKNNVISAYVEEIKNAAIYTTTRRFDADNRTRMLDTRLGDATKSDNLLKSITPQVVALTKLNWQEIYPADGWFLSEKLDGERVLIIATGSRRIILRAGSMTKDYVEGFNDANYKKGSPVTILDAELMEGDQIAHVFDYAVYNNTRAPDDFAVRVEKIPQLCDEINKRFSSLNGISLQSKYFTRIESTQARSIFSKAWEHASKTGCDGLILTPPGLSYPETKSLKWKPVDKNTIDFLVMNCPQRLLGNAPFTRVQGKTTYLLFVGISHIERVRIGLDLMNNSDQILEGIKIGDNYYPVQFSISTDPLAYIFHCDRADLHGKIVELSLNIPSEDFFELQHVANPASSSTAANPASSDKKGAKKGAVSIAKYNRELHESGTKWIFHRVREDRKPGPGYYGNNYKIAEEIYSNYIDPLPLKALSDPISGYFRASKTKLHKSSNKFRRFVASSGIEEIAANANWAIDFACGRGADIETWRNSHVANILMMDRDSSGIAELIRRKFSTMQRERRGGSQHGFDKVNENMTIYAMVRDLTTPAAELISDSLEFLPKEGCVDAVACNFAFHYFCDKTENIRNAFEYIRKMLKVGGRFMFTVMNGEAVHALLRDLPDGGVWEKHEGVQRKYSIKKKYKTASIQSTGQMISVWLDLAQDYIDEPLCNLAYVLEEASKMGFSVASCESMEKYWDKFKNRFPQHASAVTDDDREYSALFSRVILVADKNIAGGAKKRAAVGKKRKT